jgi:hypothetical protein
MFTLQTSFTQFQITFAGGGGGLNLLVEVTAIARRKTLQTLIPNYVQEFGLKGRGKGRGWPFTIFAKIFCSIGMKMHQKHYQYFTSTAHARS